MQRKAPTRPQSRVAIWHRAESITVSARMTLTRALHVSPRHAMPSMCVWRGVQSLALAMGETFNDASPRQPIPQPGLQTWFTVIQATRGWLSTLIEGARPSGDHQRSSGKRTEQARYLRAIDAGCRPTRCSSCAPRELVRRREIFGPAQAQAPWTQRAPEQSAHSSTRAECADCSAGWLRQGV